MDRWRQGTLDSWSKEGNLAIGRVVAEVRKQAHGPLYRSRIEVIFADVHVPQQITRTSIGLRSLAEAQATCDRQLAEMVDAVLLPAPTGVGRRN